MWVWVSSAAIVAVVLGVVVRTVGRRRSDPVEGLTVSTGWIVEQRAKGESSHP
jgi:hypothetical protein